MIDSKLSELRSQVEAAKKAVNDYRQTMPPEPVRGDYTFQMSEGSITLAALFEGRDDLLLIHNMGGSCAYCTMWADGYSGYLPHLTARAAFVVISPDTPEQQAKLATARGWKFNMAQDATREFTGDMGFWTEQEGWWPGVSAFHKNPDGSIVRTGYDIFGPGDDYCLPWPMFDLLSGGAADFEPH